MKIKFDPGFTLIEILAAVAVLGVVGTVMIGIIFSSFLSIIYSCIVVIIHY
jgi:prepilin-type N-terminal cleavage/methylation domain-containing protein